MRALSFGWVRAALTTLAVPGVGILLPLALVVCYITRQSQYTSNNVLQLTLRAFYFLTEQKNSLTTRHERAAPPALHIPCARCF